MRMLYENLPQMASFQRMEEIPSPSHIEICLSSKITYIYNIIIITCNIYIYIYAYENL